MKGLVYVGPVAASIPVDELAKRHERHGRGGRRDDPQKQCRGIAVHALHKSGTMFLYQFFKRLAAQHQYSFYSANNQPPNELVVLPHDSKFCCCPLRAFEIDPAWSELSNLFRIYHVRDPRDMLVSEYFSFGWSHLAEGAEGNKLVGRRQEIQKMSIDDYVLNQPEFSNWPLEQKFYPLVERDLCPDSELLVKYETMVTGFPVWVAKVIRPFGGRFPRIAAARLAWKYRNEFQPSGKGTHKRAITPGDFRKQLRPDTIAILNKRFARVIEKFEYEL